MTRASFRLYLSQYRVYIAVFVLAVGLRILVASIMQIYFGAQSFISFSDAEEFYLRLAENLVKHGTFSLNTTPPYLPEFYHVPLYPLLVAGVLYLKLPLATIPILQAIMTGITAVFIYKICQIVTKSGFISKFSAILFSVEPMYIYWSNILVSDVLYMMFFIMALYFLISRRLYLFGFVYGLAILTKPVAVLFLPLFLVIYILEDRKETTTLKFKNIVMVVLILVATVFPWLLRNKVYGDAWQISTASWYNLYVITNLYRQDNNQQTIKIISPEGYPHSGSYVFETSDSSFFRQQSIDTIKDRPVVFLRYYLGRMTDVFRFNIYDYMTHEMLLKKIPALSNSFWTLIAVSLAMVGRVYVVLMFILLSIGLITKMSIKLVYKLSFLILILVNLFFVSTMFPGLNANRYNMPVMPLLYMLAGMGIVAITENFKIRRSVFSRAPVSYENK